MYEKASLVTVTTPLEVTCRCVDVVVYSVTGNGASSAYCCSEMAPLASTVGRESSTPAGIGAFGTLEAAGALGSGVAMGASVASTREAVLTSSSAVAVLDEFSVGLRAVDF